MEGGEAGSEQVAGGGDAERRFARLEKGPYVRTLCTSVLAGARKKTAGRVRPQKRWPNTAILRDLCDPSTCAHTRSTGEPPRMGIPSYVVKTLREMFYSRNLYVCFLLSRIFLLIGHYIRSAHALIVNSVLCRTSKLLFETRSL